MKNVLIISPRFPPVNAADHQRVRMALPYFREHGWEPTILCVDPQFVEGSKDPNLLATVPEDICVESIPAIPQSLTRRIGFGGLSWRAKRSLNRRGQELLNKRAFDLLYFSTTEFGVMPLATEWKRKFGTPYILDIQDPWVNDYYRNQGKRPPGGTLKHRFTQSIASRQEPTTLRNAAAITSVSAKYENDLRTKYPFIDHVPFHVIPFGGPEYDFEILKNLDIQTSRGRQDGTQEWVYIGRAGVDMQFSLRAFFFSVKKALDCKLIDQHSVRIRLFGTDYAASGNGQQWSRQAADEFSLHSLVEEQPERIPYFEALNRLTHSNSIFVPGSDDPGYTASKIYPYILANRPLLTIFHKNSSVNNVVNQTRAGVAVTFDENCNLELVAEEIFKRWFATRAYLEKPHTDWHRFEPYTAREMTDQITRIFDQTTANHKRRIAS